MTTKEEKPKTYFGVVPKEELPGFLDRLKKGLTEGQKTGDKKELEIEIKGGKDEPTGLSIENFTIDEKQFGEYFDPSAKHMEKALFCCTVNLEVKDEKDVETLKGAFEMLNGMFAQISFVKNKPGKYELHFRNNGKKVAIDLVSLEGKLIQPLLDLGIDLSKFHNFCFALKTGANLGKIFTEGANPSDELIADVLNVLVRVKSSGENIKYLATAFIGALKDLKLSNEELQKKLEKMLGFLNLINVFIGAKVKFEYDAKVLKGEGDKAVANLPGGAAGVKQQLAGFHGMATQSGKAFLKPTLDGLGFTDKVKSLNLDCISIAGGVPKYKNGVAFVLKVPGLTQVLEEFLK